MGDVLRRYWIPAFLARELPEPDCPPVRVQLLGERLVGFRDSQGRIGLVDEFCPHRRASLWFGRNEESGLRCIYHGWKFDVDGNCLDQMNEPEQFCHKIHLTAYPTTEMGGVVWTYMGPRERMPAPPAFEWTQVPESHRHVSKLWEECNWPGARRRYRHFARPDPPSYDHAQRDAPGHSGKWSVCPRQGADPGGRRHRLRLPLCRDPPARRRQDLCALLPFRHAVHADPAQHCAARWAAAIGPTSPATSGFRSTMRTAWWNWMYSFGEAGLSEEDRMERGNGNGPDYVEQSGEFRSLRNKRNDWMIDRRSRNTRPSRVSTASTPRTARSRKDGAGRRPVERASQPADRAIIATRRLPLDAVKTCRRRPARCRRQLYSARAIEKIFPAKTLGASDRAPRDAR
jgi:nitrite reductase/ring-hydroxylating ferredoxin subunit